MYKFTEKNLLDQRENYMYTPFMGIQFIHDFFNSRNEYQNKIKAILESPNTEIKVLDLGIKFISSNFINCHIINEDKFSKKIVFQEFSEGLPKYNSNSYYKNLETFSYLTSLTYELIISSEITTLLKSEINKIIQRFEVSKKIYNNYEIKFSKGNGSYENIENYLLLSCLLNIYYFRKGSLSSLNCILKLMDLIISQPLKNNLENNYFLYIDSLINFEKFHISNLIKKSGINL